MPKRRRKQTVSLAVAASVVEVAQTQELATAVAGQLARAAAIFNIDEMVVVDDSHISGYGPSAWLASPGSRRGCSLTLLHALQGWQDRQERSLSEPRAAIFGDSPVPT